MLMLSVNRHQRNLALLPSRERFPPQLELQSLAADKFMQTVGNYSVELVMSLLSTHGRIQWSVISQEMLDADKFAILC